MKIEKIYSNNDIYFIEIVQDKIIINDNYEGVIILDGQLNIVKKFELLDDMVVDVSFIKNSEVVLYCYENQCFIYLDINTYAYKIISLDSEYVDMSFLSLYEWCDNELLLLAESGKILVRVNLLTYTVTVQKYCNKNRLLSVYQDFEKLNKMFLHKVYPDKKIAIIEKDNILKIINYKKQSLLPEIMIDIKNKEFYDVEVINEFIVLVDEYKIIVSNSIKNINLFPSTKGYRFLRCKFIYINKEVFLVVLSCCDADSSVCKLEKYSLENDLLI